ncbi:hypothetical protein NIES2100_14530 [Calothrix sp. NIES-2100]|uniref:hypothetical protein n=1 Tax=Calothrix sp. NIES-2100 TaxID=1954172 RepID=UPI000B61F801|nr:hypothetical protein NIES2100_14530 [Calothrix sp. NIES-2100]
MTKPIPMRTYSHSPQDPDYLLPQIDHCLDTFGEHLSALDFAIECLEDLKKEIAEGTNDAQTTDAYLYGALSRLKDAKKYLSQDISTIKRKLSDFLDQRCDRPMPNNQ